MADIEQDLGLLSLEGDEGDGGTEIPELDALEEEDTYELCVVGEICTDKEVNFELFRNHMADLRRPFRGMRIEELEDHRILFRFFHMLDLRWVIDNGPWTYDSWLVAMKEIDHGVFPMEVSLHEAEFWVQGHALPASFCTEAVGRVIGDHVVSFVAFDGDHRGNGRVRHGSLAESTVRQKGGVMGLDSFTKANDEMMEDVNEGTKVGEDRVKRRRGEKSRLAVGEQSSEEANRSFGNDITNIGS
ncbi:hypothetical protein LINGRAHAP2_LOCUS534 [Linum grandiflorum]